jgi:hypothetical protein
MKNKWSFVLSATALIVALLGITAVGGAAYKSHSSAGKASGAAKIAKKKKPKVVRGPRGFRGLRGPAGPQGPQGIQGPQGLQGPAGSPDTPAQVRDKLIATGGAFRVSAGTSNWTRFSSDDPVSVTYYSNGPYFSRSSAGDNYIVNHPSIPISVYGKALRVKAMRICYSASTTASISLIYLQITHFTTSGTGTYTEPIFDSTSHTTSTCHEYSLASAASLSPGDDLTVLVSGHWTAAGTIVLGDVSLLLQPGSSDVTSTSSASRSMAGPAGAASAATNH